MNTTRFIDGLECNLTLSRDGETVRSAVVLLGSADHAGMRSRDGDEAQCLRKLARRHVAAKLGLPLDRVRAAARFTRLVSTEVGIAARDDSGRVVGYHLQ